MSRGRTYRVETVLEAAKETFWRLGYDRAAVSALEAATGVSRSSLYQAFGSKARLFALVLDAYICGFVGPLLEPLEGTGAPEDAVERFVRTLRELFADEGLPARYGCLWVNSIVEFAGRDGAPVDVRAAEFWDRLNTAYCNALRCAAPRERDGLTSREHRARMLAAATFAGWLTVRVDARRAQAVCDCMLIEVASWWRPADAAA